MLLKLETFRGSGQHISGCVLPQHQEVMLGVHAMYECSVGSDVGCIRAIVGFARDHGRGT
jgi:hypothetical protein